jgi:hypothetical protein
MYRPVFLDEDWVAGYATHHLGSEGRGAAFLVRARAVLSAGSLCNCHYSPPDHLTATCTSSTPHLTYNVDVRVAQTAGATAASCTCPSRQQEAVCKHVLALLLWAVGAVPAEPAAAPTAARPTQRRRMPASLQARPPQQQEDAPQQQQQQQQQEEEEQQQQPQQQSGEAAGSVLVHADPAHPQSVTRDSSGASPVAATRPAKRARRAGPVHSTRPAPSRRKPVTGTGPPAARRGTGGDAAAGGPPAPLLSGPAMLALLPEQLAAEARWVLTQVQQVVSSAPAPAASLPGGRGGDPQLATGGHGQARLSLQPGAQQHAGGQLAPGAAHNPHLPPPGQLSQHHRVSPSRMPPCHPGPADTPGAATSRGVLAASAAETAGTSQAQPPPQRVSRLLSTLLGEGGATATASQVPPPTGSVAGAPRGADIGKPSAAAEVTAGAGVSTQPAVLPARRRPMWEKLLQQNE